MRVAEAAFAAFGNRERRFRFVQIAKQIACRGIEDQRSDGNLDDAVFTVDAVHLTAATISTVLRLPRGLVAQRHSNGL